MAKKKSKTSRSGAGRNPSADRAGRGSDALGMLQEIIGSLDEVDQQALFESLLGDSFPSEVIRKPLRARNPIDQLILDGLEEPTPEKAIPKFEKAVALARRKIGKKFDQRVGQFDEFSEGKTFVAASGQLVAALQAAGRTDESINLGEELLRLAPQDEWGVRDLLLRQYLAETRLDDAQRLLERFPESSAAHEFGLVLLAVLQNRPDSEIDPLLVFAHQANPCVIDHLLQGEWELPEPSSWDDESLAEARQYAIDFRGAWRASGRAVSWLRQAAQRLQLDRPLAGGAEPPPDSARFPPSALKSLPLHDHREWLAGVIRLEGDPPGRQQSKSGHWLRFAMSLDGDPLAMDIHENQPNADDLWDLLVDAMTSAKEPARPQSIYVAPRELLQALKSEGRGSGIRFAKHPDSESLDQLLQKMSSVLGRLGNTTAVTADEVESTPCDPAAEWEVAVTQIDERIGIGGEIARPWVSLVVNRRDGTILATDLQTDPPGSDSLPELVRRAIVRPAIGERHRPAIVYVRTADDAHELAPPLGTLGIQVEVSASFEYLDQALSSLAVHLAGEPAVPPLIDSPGIDQPLLAAYYQAAAQYYVARPWAKFDSDAVFKIASPLAPDSPWYAGVMGQSAMILGLSIYRKLSTFRRLMNSDPATRDPAHAAQQMDAISVQFGEEFDLAPRDSDAVVQFGWPIAAPEAYPLLLVVRPGAKLESPSADELQIVTECLEAVAGFIKQPQSLPLYTGTNATVTYLGAIDDL